MDQKIAARFETLEELLRQNLAAINELTSEFRAFRQEQREHNNRMPACSCRGNTRVRDPREIAEACFKEALDRHSATVRSETAWDERLENGGAIKRYTLHQSPKVARRVEECADRLFFHATDDESLRHRRGDALVSVCGTTSSGLV